MDTISSARALPPKETTSIALFEQGYYAGQMVVLYDSNPDLPSSTGFDSNINSLIITKGEWTFFEATDYEGGDVTLTGEVQYDQSTPRLRTRQFRSVKKN